MPIASYVPLHSNKILSYALLVVVVSGRRSARTRLKVFSEVVERQDALPQTTYPPFSKSFFTNSPFPVCSAS